MDRIGQYLKYHADSSKAWDIDIQVEAVEWVCRQLNLNIEQRLWLSFLFACTYSMATAWVIFNQLPRFDYGTEAQLEAWWRGNRNALLFQTDRARIRSNNQFTAVVLSYRRMVRKWSPRSGSQFEALTRLFARGETANDRYEVLVRDSGIFQFGRFSMFLYSELLFHSRISVCPTLNLAEARSVRNGVVFAMGLEKYSYTVRGGREATKEELQVLTEGLNTIIERVQAQDITPRHKSIWSIETTLCAFKKYNLGKRYVGYYVKRTLKEVAQMRLRYPSIPWGVMDSFSRHYYRGLTVGATERII